MKGLRQEAFDGGVVDLQELNFDYFRIFAAGPGEPSRRPDSQQMTSTTG